MTQPTTIIRPATSDDAQGIAHVHIEAWQSAYRGIVADEFLDTISEDERTDRIQNPGCTVGCRLF